MKQLDYRTEDRESRAGQVVWGVLLLALLLFGGHTIAAAEVVGGEPGGDSEVMVEPIEPLSAGELDELVGPVALYPDDLLSIVLAASTYPLQVVQASRFLAQREQNPDLQPDKEWDDSVVALLNYPEALALLNDDLDWTWKLGEAVLAQQEDVLTAVADFRERARVAGNLESDERQVVEVVDDGVIEIKPADPEVIYVPYYEPSRVTVYHDYPVYHYYPRAYPVYYYPYPAGYRFSVGYFWGVTSAFSIGWSSHRLHLHHHAFHGHPYYGRTYYDHYYYRRPHLSLTYNYYRDYSHYRHSARRHHAGNYWRPRSAYYGSSPRHAYRRWAYRDGQRHHRRDHRDRRRHREQRDVRDRHFAHDNAARYRHRDTDRRAAADDGQRSVVQAPRRGDRRTTRQPTQVQDSTHLAAPHTAVQGENLRVLTQGNIRSVTPQRSVAGKRRHRDAAPRRNRESLDSRIANNRGRAPQAMQAPRSVPKVGRSAPHQVQRAAARKSQGSAAQKAQRAPGSRARHAAANKARHTAQTRVQRAAPRTTAQRAKRQIVKPTRAAPGHQSMQARAQRQAQVYAQRSVPARAAKAQSQRRSAPKVQSSGRSAPKAQHRGTRIRQSAGNRSGKRVSFARN